MLSASFDIGTPTGRWAFGAFGCGFGIDSFLLARSVRRSFNFFLVFGFAKLERSISLRSTFAC